MTHLHPKYREDRATQVAARLLHLCGGTMNHLKLAKLLYLVERDALTRLGAPMTFDSCSSRADGPGLDATSDRINAGETDQIDYWGRYITAKADFTVTLRSPEVVPSDQLSRAEEALIEEVFAKHGHLGLPQLVEYARALPEWSDPEGSLVPISRDQILRCEGFSDEEIAGIEAEWAEVAFARALTS